MTVGDIRADKIVDAEWFVAGKPKRYAFAPAELRLHWFDALCRWLAGSRSPGADVVALAPKTPWIGQPGRFRTNEQLHG
jgi:hypothetical protein